MSGFFCCYKPKSKVRDIYRETHKPSEDALHDARNKVEATIGIAEGTDIELRQQGTQIDRIDSTVDAVKTDTKIAEHDLRGVRSCWGYFWNKITPCCQPKHQTITSEPPTVKSNEARDALSKNDKQAIDTGLDRLQELADGMGREIERQNGVLNELDDNVVDTADKIANITQKTTATRVQIGGSV